MNAQATGYRKRIEGLMHKLGAECVPVPLKLGLICESVKNRLLEGRAQDGDARIAVGEMPELKADAGQMELFFFLLLENALESARDGVRPIIAVSSEIVNSGIRIRVQDNGTGLAPTGERDAELVTARRVVENHGGQLRIEHRPGFGTSVIAELPWAGTLHAKRRRHNYEKTR